MNPLQSIKNSYFQYNQILGDCFLGSIYVISGAALTGMCAFSVFFKDSSVEDITQNKMTYVSKDHLTNFVMDMNTLTAGIGLGAVSIHYEISKIQKGVADFFQGGKK